MDFILQGYVRTGIILLFFDVFFSHTWVQRNTRIIHGHTGMICCPSCPHLPSSRMSSTPSASVVQRILPVVQWWLGHQRLLPMKRWPLTILLPQPLLPVVWSHPFHRLVPILTTPTLPLLACHLPTSPVHPNPPFRWPRPQ